MTDAGNKALREYAPLPEHIQRCRELLEVLQHVSYIRWFVCDFFLIISVMFFMFLILWFCITQDMDLYMGACLLAWHVAVLARLCKAEPRAVVIANLPLPEFRSGTRSMSNIPLPKARPIPADIIYLPLPKYMEEVRRGTRSLPFPRFILPICMAACMDAGNGRSDNIIFYLTLAGIIYCVFLWDRRNFRRAYNAVAEEWHETFLLLQSDIREIQDRTQGCGPGLFLNGSHAAAVNEDGDIDIIGLRTVFDASEYSRTVSKEGTVLEYGHIYDDPAVLFRDLMGSVFEDCSTEEIRKLCGAAQQDPQIPERSRKCQYSRS